MRKLFQDANLVIYLNTVTGEQRPIIDRFFNRLLKERLFTNMLVLEGYNVAVPEVLLLLKHKAAKEGSSSEKGVKDRADLLCLLLCFDWKPDFLSSRSLVD